MIEVGCYKLHKDAVTPSKGSENSACYDLRVCFHEKEVKFHNKFYNCHVKTDEKDIKFIQLYPNDLALIPTGLIFCLPKTHHLKLYSRSGNVWKRLLTVANQPAVIDSDYTDETYILLHNQSDNVQTIKEGDAIAQCEVCKNKSIDFVEFYEPELLDEFKEYVKERSSRDGGLGSTGR